MAFFIFMFVFLGGVMYFVIGQFFPSMLPVVQNIMSIVIILAVIKVVWDMAKFFGNPVEFLKFLIGVLFGLIGMAGFIMLIYWIFNILT